MSYKQAFPINKFLSCFHPKKFKLIADYLELKVIGHNLTSYRFWLNLLFIFSGANVAAQSSNDLFVDFHAHIPTKNIYSNITNIRQQGLLPPVHIFVNDLEIQDLDKRIEQVKRALDSINVDDTLRYLLWKNPNQKITHADAGLQSNFDNYNQCDFQHIATRNYAYVVASFCPLEKQTVNGGVRRKLNSKVVSKIPANSLSQLLFENSDLENLLAEYNLIRIQAEYLPENPDRKITFLKDSKHLQSMLATNHQNQFTTGMLFSIEGCHILSNKHNNLNKLVKGLIDSFELQSWNVCGDSCWREIQFSIRLLKNLKHHLFFVSPGHFCWNNISGNARAMDKPFFRNFIRLVPRFFTKKYNQGLIDTIYARDKRLLRKKYWVPDTSFNPMSDHFPFDFKRDTKGNALAGLKRPFGLSRKYEVVSRTTNNELGRRVIEEFLREDDNDFKKPTYIDLKHMDVQARYECIKLIQELNKNRVNKIPLIVSHAACNGENLEWSRLTSNFPFFDKYNELDWEGYYHRIRNKYYKMVDKLKDPILSAKARSTVFVDLPKYEGYFYPWGIGLYDEEIQQVYESKGLIAIMADERTLGYMMKNQKAFYKNNDTVQGAFVEYSNHIWATTLLKEKTFIAEDRFGCKDTSNAGTSLPYSQIDQLIGDSKAIYENLRQEDILYSMKPLLYHDYLNAEPFFRNLVYILNKSGYVYKDVQGALQLNPQAWDHVAIGTDFDGFINPINIFPTSYHIKTFREYVKLYLPFFLLTNPHIRTQPNDIWDFRILSNQSIDSLLNKLFYDNASKFIEKYF